MSWFYEKDGGQQGPVEEPELKQLRADGQIGDETLIWKEGMESWTPYREVLPTAEQPSSPPPAAAVVDPYAPPAEALAEHPPGAAAQVGAMYTDLPHPDPVDAPADYQVDIGGLISRSFKVVFSPEFWPLLGAYLVTMMILSASGGALGQLWLFYPLLGGLNLYIAHIIRGVPRDFGDIFLGFKRNFGQLAILNLVIMGPLVGVILIVYIAIFGGMMLSIPMEQMAADNTAPPEFNPSPLLFIGFGLLLVAMLVFWYVTIVTQFATMLCIDRLMSWKDSLRVSYRTAKKHFWMLLLFGVVSQFLAGIGVLACYVGALVTAPIVVVAHVLLYEDIWGRPTSNGEPLPHSRSGGTSNS